MPADVLWKSMPLSPKELSLARVLRCGQAFRWKNVNNVWSVSTQDQIVLLRQDDAALHYAAIGPETAGAGPPPHAASHFVRDYFNLHVQLEALYRAWAEVEARFSNGLKRAAFGLFPGIRMLRQEPWETVVLFICSSNNNVKRISKMCDAVCAEYGTYINEHGGVRYYSFPGPDALAAAGVEGRLRELGFGYRARYIHQTAQMFVDAARPEISVAALYELRNRLYEEAHGFLLRLTGVGPKVADCICLMALDKHDVVPVDTHVMQIAVRDYKFRGPRAMTQKAYHQVRGHLRSLFGDYAGWAQLVMFAADLSDLNNGINQLDGAPVRHEVKGEASVRTGTEVETSVKPAKRVKSAA
ncbi:DNA glycosylase [Metschnikowia bicuspidata var. bicuspidata NRRL YB-4993]|uniref:DNA-(apurinic or apyrimidinic site) lyase n=1 Tax=Metschnikowia bicuspidata var. bicuspidata NRRL YB-4993 TaxID=869754 RepID=A0A1A0HFM9_9ASCO|nr:DNA glycosylase [Metschnikowia bicuspidata var. bicuspidata NRRL YB-4993]OBA22959.1 DNA glycosylase [Metschnikowia bicuspidata var. bicuspidata NRRL YB-4993]